MRKVLNSKVDENPFVDISLQWRVLLIAYVVVYTVLTPGLREIVAGSSAPLSGPRMMAKITYQVLLFAPILFYRPRFGWLHPLIFPPLFGIAKSLIKDQGQLLAPLSIGHPVNEVLRNPELPDVSIQRMATATLELQLLSILALLCYYAGFFFAQRYTNFDFKPARLHFSSPRRVVPICAAVVGLSALTALYWIQSHGGLNSYLLGYLGGRRDAGEAGGSIFFVVGLGIIACTVWYALDEKAARNPFFWAAAVYAIVINFFMTGSRSGIFNGAALLLLIWMMRHHKTPKARVVVLALMATTLVSVLGNFRSSAHRGRLDWSVFTETSVSEAYTETNEEIDRRQSIQGGVPAIARVPEEVDYLWGESYVASVLFFVPRFIWENKPKGPGSMNGERILGRCKGCGAAPMGTVAEAYWNFSIPGVIVVFFLFGIFHKGLARLLRRYPYAPVWVLYAFLLFKIKPSGQTFSRAARDVTAVVGLLFLVKGFAWRRGGVRKDPGTGRAL